MTVIFYIAAAVGLAATVMVITRTNAVHALLYLIVSLLSVAVIFYILGAPFIAALEVIIYAGAIMVLFIFVMMMLNLGKKSAEQERSWLSPGMYLGPGLLSAVLACILIWGVTKGGAHAAPLAAIQPREVGVSMFTTYLFAVELAAMLLLAALLGAFHIGRKRDSNSDERRELGHPLRGTAQDEQEPEEVHRA